MKTLSIILLTGTLFASQVLLAQGTNGHVTEKAKLPIYGNIAVGYGNTFFSGTLGEKETNNDERGFGRNDGTALGGFFYAAPEKWKGLGVGFGAKGFIARPNNGGNDETYLFNYYHVGPAAKYYPFSREFNRGLCAKAGVGFGQMTEKMRYNSTKIYEHQFAIGTTLLLGVGWSFPIGHGHTALTFDLDYQTSRWRGDVTGIGEDQPFSAQHVSANVGIMF
jgi:hypothetical protein